MSLEQTSLSNEPTASTMSLKEQLRSALNPSVKIDFPSSDEEARYILQRWSNNGIFTPFAVTVPSDEDEVASIVRFASSHNLQVVVGGRGRGSFVPVGSNTLYIDLQKFNEISVDAVRGAVTIGGGVTTGQTLKACAQKGVYTLVPNANSVGVVGAVLGGDSNHFNSIRGLGGDNIVSVRMVTAQGKVVEVHHDSSSSERDLLRMLGRTGYGLGVVTSLTLRAWPVSSLKMKDDKVWVRTLVFPATAVDTVAKLYCDLQPPPRALQLTLIITRPPLESHQTGPPSIIFSTSYFGPSEEAERIAAPLLQADVEKTALVARTAFVPIQDLNNASEMTNQAGQYKEMYSCMLKQVEQSSITEAFSNFVHFGNDTEDARDRSYLVFSCWNPTVSVQTATERKENNKYMRDRGILTQAVPWYSKPATKEVAGEFGRQFVRNMQRVDDNAGVGRMTLKHYSSLDQDPKEAYNNELRSEYLQVKKMWDPKNVFWSPVVEE